MEYRAGRVRLVVCCGVYMSDVENSGSQGGGEREHGCGAYQVHDSGLDEVGGCGVVVVISRFLGDAEVGCRKSYGDAGKEEA